MSKTATIRISVIFAFILVMAITIASVVSTAASETTTINPRQSNAHPTAHLTPDTWTNADELLNMISIAEPAFGGMYIDQETKELKVLLTDMGRINQARTAIEIAVAGKVTLPPNGVAAVKAKYRMSDLYQWYNLSWKAVPADQTAFSSDLAEASNRIRFQIDNESQRPQVEEILIGKGVPLDAVIIEVASRGQLASHTLQQAYSNLNSGKMEGGIQIRSADGGNCTLGFIADLAGVRGFVTNAHCTAEDDIGPCVAPGWGCYHASNLNIYQPDSATNDVGDESSDPGFFGSGTDANCPSASNVCRHSDSAWIVRDSGESTNLGYIAQPTGFYTGNTNVSHTNPRFRIMSTGPTPLTGEALHKVARSKPTWGT